MERAVVIRNASEFSEASNYDRVYFGCEFCDRMLPGKGEFKRAVAAAAQAGVPLTLLTPVCTDPGLKNIEALLAGFPTAPQQEVVANDWGVAALCVERGIPLVIGRVLIAGCRDPRFFDRMPNQDPQLLDYIRSSSMNAVAFQEFFLQHKITRVELDNTLQFYNFKPLPGMHVSLHVPDVYTSTTRRCLYPYIFGEQEQAILSVHSCRKECLRGNVSMRFPGYSKELFIKGNTQFYENGVLPGNHILKQFHIDRIVVNAG